MKLPERLQEPSAAPARSTVPLIVPFTLLFIGLVMLYMFGQVSTLHCDLAGGGVATCTRSISMMRQVPVEAPVTLQLRQATLDETCDTHGCKYRVLLAVDGGESIPYSDVYTSDQGAHQRMADTINAYLAGQSGPALDLETGGGWVLLAPAAVLLAALVTGAVSILQRIAGR